MPFTVTWDYRCPFARNVHEHLVTALDGGAPWEVHFAPFSLGQVHVAEGEPDVWDVPEKDSGLLALQAGVVVRDRFPEEFRAVHVGLFAARHDHGGQLADEAVVRGVLAGNGVDADAVFAEIADGSALKAVRTEHEAFVASHNVWGVPTFISGDQAVFVRLMTRREGDPAVSRVAVERILGLIDSAPELNEYKHTSIPR